MLALVSAFIEETTEQFFDRMFSVNAKAPFFIIQQALPRLRDNSRIINISSAPPAFLYLILLHIV